MTAFAALLAAVTAAPFVAPDAQAHHGWSSFDQERPVYLSGSIKSVRWQNPHAELVLVVDAALKAPADLAGRGVPAQQQSVDGAAILKKAQVPDKPGGEWQIEFAPLFRMQAWGLGEAPKVGDRIEVVGYASPRVQGGRLVRVEYMFMNGKAYAFRSSPA
jgi:hypothetical protein